MNVFRDLPDLTPEQFQRFAVLIFEKARITLKDTKITLLSNRLRKRIRALELNDFEEYYRYLTRNMAEELPYFLEVVTTNESYFWRTVQNYEMLKENILPELMEKFRGETLLFWSAGCSTGEEPYNLAMELTESMKMFGVFKFKILATDISKRVIEFAREGRYSGRKLEKIPPLLLNRYFVADPEYEGHYVVRPDIKEKVEFRLANLFEEVPPAQHCIFCRNVMIYFSREVQETLVDKFYSILKPSGYLIIGHSETLQVMKTKFKAIPFPKGVAYKKNV